MGTCSSCSRTPPKPVALVDPPKFELDSELNNMSRNGDGDQFLALLRELKKEKSAPLLERKGYTRLQDLAEASTDELIKATGWEPTPVNLLRRYAQQRLESIVYPPSTVVRMNGSSRSMLAAESSSGLNEKLWSTFADLLQSMAGQNMTFSGGQNNVLTMMCATPLSAPWGKTDTTLHALNTEREVKELLETCNQLVGSFGNLHLTAATSSSSNAIDVDGMQELVNQSDDSYAANINREVDKNTSGPRQGGQFPTSEKPPVDAAFNANGGKTIDSLKLAPRMVDFMNKVAFLPAQYGPIYSPGTVRCADAYRALLLSIAIGLEPNAKAKVDKALEELMGTKSYNSKIQTTAVQEYVAYKRALLEAGYQPTPLAQWLDDEGWTPKLQSSKTAMNVAVAAFRQVVQECGLKEDLINAVTAVQKDIPQLFQMGDDPDNMIQNWKRQQFNPISVTKSTANSTYSLSSTSWGASASGMYSFISFGGGGGGSRTSIRSTSLNVTITFSAKGILEIPIQAGDVTGDSWFRSGVISEYCGNLDNSKNEWAEKSMFYGANPKRNPYGPKGFLPYWPVAVVICYQPSYTLTMTNTDFQQDESSWKTSASIGIGPFSFGGSAEHRDVKIQQNSDTTTITLSDSTDVPKILAFKMQIFPPQAQ